MRRRRFIKKYMKSESVGNMSKSQELRAYIDELHTKIDYDDYVNLINLVDEIDTQFNCQEDLREWIVDNFDAIEEDVSKSITKFCKGKAFEGKNINLKTLIDREELQESICENLKEGLLNVIDTYEVKE